MARNLLRVDDLALELIPAGELGCVAFPVAIVAGTHVQEVATNLQGLAGVSPPRADCPGGVLCRPFGPLHQVLEADVTVDSMFFCGLVNVLENVRPVGDGLGILPGLEAESQRMHIAVGADTGVLEQIPGAAHVLAPLQYHIALAGTFGLQVHAGTDAGQARTDHDNVKIFCAHWVEPPLFSSNR
jgi:hypothetical protein